MFNRRSRSRSPLSRGNDDNEKQFHLLFVGNLPKHWHYNDIKSFVISRCKSAAITHTLKYVNILKDKFGKSRGECLLKFTSYNACLMALNLLRGAECENKKIVVMQDSGQSFQQLDNSSNFKKDTSHIPSLNNQTMNVPPSQPGDNLAEKANETYGLSMNFLEALNISLPLVNRIFVTNLSSDVNETNLRELFGLAGQITEVMLIHKSNSKIFATIGFDHPVEAVQAISMFDGQDYMDKRLNVKMDRKPTMLKKILPPKLKSIGPGLGPNGEPLRGVRNVLEFEPLKQLLIQELTRLQTSKMEESTNANSNQTPTMTGNSMDMMNNLMSLQNPMGLLLNVNAFNQLNQQAWGQSMLNLQGAQNLQMMQGLLQPNVTTDLTALQAQQNMPNFSQNNLVGMVQNQSTIPQSQMANVNQTQWGSGSQNQFPMSQSNSGRTSQYTDYQDTITQKMQIVDNDRDRRSDDDYVKSFNEFDIERCSTMDKYKDSYRPSESPNIDDKDRHMTSDMLVFRNLPSSVSAKALSSKMSEVGEVKFAELTGQGRAIVRFSNIRDAERCIRMFDHSKVDGQTINVSYF